MSTSLKLYATSNGKSVNSTFSSLNTNATPAQMKSAAQALNSLTDNTYSKSEKIETTELDSFAPKLTPNIALSSTVDTSTLTRSFCLGGQNLLLVVETDGEISSTTIIRRGVQQFALGLTPINTVSTSELSTRKRQRTRPPGTLSSLNQLKPLSMKLDGLNFSRYWRVNHG